MESNSGVYRAYFDCSVNGNPSFGVGFVVVDPSGKIVFKGSEEIRYSQTYPMGKKHWGTYKKEQTALLRLLKKLVELKINRVAIFGDHTQLIVRVKKYYTNWLLHKPMSTRDLLNLKGQMSRIVGHLRAFSDWTLEKIPSNQNIVADYLAKKAVNGRRHDTIDEFTEFRHWEVEHLTWTDRY